MKNWINEIWLNCRLGELVVEVCGIGGRTEGGFWSDVCAIRTTLLAWLCSIVKPRCAGTLPARLPSKATSTKTHQMLRKIPALLPWWPTGRCSSSLTSSVPLGSVKSLVLTHQWLVVIVWNRQQYRKISKQERKRRKERKKEREKERKKERK